MDNELESMEGSCRCLMLGYHVKNFLGGTQENC
jgi:hypothetical protein